MLTYNEFIDLRDKLINNEIEIELAKEQCWKGFKKGQRSWHTKDWKERRLKFINEKCQICSSTDTLTLQHLSHPKKFNEYLREITNTYTNQYINNNSKIDKSDFRNHVLNNYEYVPTPLCPNCMNKNPNKRLRKIPKYRCADCKHEFPEAVYRSANELVSIFFKDKDDYKVRDKCFVSKDKWRNQRNLSNIKYWFQRNIAKNNEAESIEKKAFILYLNDNIKYLSFEDTITACRKCASNYDLHGMELCPKCKEYYKGIQYSTCVQCLPEEKRKSALEMIEYGKEWRAIHKKLGID